MSGAMPLRRGVHAGLEAAADAILKDALKDVTRHADKADLLTPWKLQERTRREVYVPSGAPDAMLRQGIFTRAMNPTSPHLNSREGTAGRARRRDMPAPVLEPYVEDDSWDRE